METSKGLSEEEIEKCKAIDGKWVCPIPSCMQKLSRKQTLKLHLENLHEIQGGRPGKRYKVYESDTNIPVPRTTQYRRNLQEGYCEDVVSCESVTQDATEKSRHDDTDTTIVQSSKISTVFCNTENENFSDDEMNQTVLQSDLRDNFEERDMDICSEDYNEGVEFPDSDDNENDNYEDCNESINTAPLYCFPPSEEPHLSSITHYEHIISLCAYASKNNLSNCALKELMQLVKVHMPPKSLCESDPNVIKEECGFTNEFMMYHDYCDNCGALFSPDKTFNRCSTEGCNETRCANTDDRHGKTFFVTGSIEKQLKEVVGRAENVNFIINKSERPLQSDIFDIQDGELYHQMTAPGGFLHHKNTNISLTIFTDGVSLFKSTQTSYWPVYIVINELPPKQRFLRKNMILWGLWQGVGKPRMNTFFFPFVKEMRRFYFHGIEVKAKDISFVVKATVCMVTMDLQARAYIFNMTQHNGSFGCIFCEQEGQSVPSGKGHCRAYQYMTPKAPLRTADSVADNANTALASQKAVSGFFGRSILAFLPNFKIPDNVGIDYMHGVLLGVVKKLMSIWFDGKSYKERFFIGHKAKGIEDILTSIKQPYLIHRKPRVIMGNLNHWKASEFRSWLLFYSVPCLQDILPEEYFIHYCCLVEGIFILLGEKINHDQLNRAEILLNTFYELAGDLYGANINSMNIHNLSHYITLVRNWGPLWVYSCFAFESFNGEINKTIHGKGNVSREVFWAIYREKILEESFNSLPTGECKRFVEKLIKTRKNPDTSILGHMCLIHEPVTVFNILTLNDSVRDDVCKLFGSKVNGNDLVLQKAQKISRNDFIFYSELCTRVKNAKSNVALLTCEIKGCHCIEIGYFIYSPISKKTVAVGSGMAVQGCLVDKRVPHIQKVIRVREQIAVPAELLKEPVVYMKISNTEIVAQFPNFIERD